MKKRLLIFAIILGGILIISCERITPKVPAEDQILDGPIEGLSSAEKARFLAGDVAFNDEIFTSETGLGSVFVATSCGSCHAGDGRGSSYK